METQNTVSECPHNTEERALIGTWVLCEIKLALQNGYIILDMFEVWQYQTVQYDSTTKTGGD